MERKYIIYLIVLILFPVSVFSQSEISSQIQDLIEEITDEVDEAEIATIYEHLEEVLANPIDVNTASKEQLESLFFLSDFQIYTFIEFREKYGRLLSLKELNLIIGFNQSIIDKIQAFIYVGHDSYKDNVYLPIRYSDIKIINRYTSSLPIRKGFENEIDSLTKFSGNNYSKLFKVQYKSGKDISAGLTMESDAGEAISFDNKTKGFDFYSAFFQLRRPGKKINNIILGDYRISSGLGLIHGYGFSSKSSETLIKRKFTEIKKFSSTAESGFYRGMAINSKFSNFESFIYYSRKRQSTNLKYENEDIFFNSIDLSGLHRNASEEIPKNSIYEQNTGFVFSRTNNSSRFSYSANLSQFDVPYQYREYPDRYSNLIKETNFFNQSIYYNKLFSKLLLSGELAFDKNQHIAIQQIINAYLHPLLSLSISYRYFSPKYIALHSKSFAESSGSRNEKGFYIGIETFPFRFLILNAYIDNYSFPWMRYNDTSPYSGTDMLINAKWLLNKSFYIKTMLKREYYFKKTSAENNPIASMEAVNNSRFILQTNYDYSEKFNLRNKIEIKRYLTKDEKTTGYLLYQEINKKFPAINLSMNFRYTVFDIPNWDVRIYSWEHDLLYSFYTPAFYRTGQNLLFNFRYSSRNLKLGLKGSFNFYKNEYTSGSGTEKRSGKIFSLWKVQWVYSI